MPELSRFLGIIIRMYYEVDERHSTPHFHAYAGGSSAVYSIDSAECIAGELPARQDRIVIEWAIRHRRELRDAWYTLQRGEIPERIAPE